VRKIASAAPVQCADDVGGKQKSMRGEGAEGPARGRKPSLGDTPDEPRERSRNGPGAARGSIPTVYSTSLPTLAAPVHSLGGDVQQGYGAGPVLQVGVPPPAQGLTSATVLAGNPNDLNKQGNPLRHMPMQNQTRH